MTATIQVRHQVYWHSPAPECCDICNVPITDTFVDGRTYAHSSWGCFCPSCHDAYGVGLGTGKGQKYQRLADSKFVKVED